MKQLIYLLLLLLTQCTFRINSTKDGYLDLSKDQKKNILQFSSSEQKVQPFQFVEITSENIKSSCTRYDYTLVYQLAPWCVPCVREFKKDFKMLDSLSKASTKIRILVVNNSYGFENSIEKLYKSLNYTEPIYVLSNSEYGDEIENKVNKFVKELCIDCVPSTNGGVFLLDRGVKLLAYYLKIDEQSELLDLIK